MCGTRRIKRSHRNEEEKALYPEAKFYRCRKCETRFVHAVEAEGADQSTTAEPQITAEDDAGAESGGPPDVVYVGIFVLACVVAAVVIYVLGRG